MKNDIPNLCQLVMKHLAEKSLQNTTGIKPKMIEGTGVLAQRTFWIDAANKLRGSTTKFKKKRGRGVIQ